MLTDAAQVVTLAAFFATLSHIVFYAPVSRWWATALGRSTMALDAALTLALLPATLHYLLGVTIATSDGFAWLVVCAIGAVALIALWRVAILLRLQLRHRDKEDA